ncbi:MAG: threonine synthase [Odoribacteraceae bacterium]|jgi:threonine synthase|nr:threonine synthase [Odoribacteraceae bacterium]
MRFTSTRGGDTATFSQAVIKGLAGDGGLFVPETLPDISLYLKRWHGLPYTELASSFLSLFATDIPRDELNHCVELAYSDFPDPITPAPLVKLSDNLHVMELFHGPTLAFKDFALQLLGQFYGRHIRDTGHSLNILGATSGDTGSAAIHGMLKHPGVHSFILYPEGCIAELQERQIACTGSPFVHPFAIKGSFDDTQDIVKQIFGDATFSSTHSLAAVNSINIARLLAQCVYYLHAALKLEASEDNPLEFIVPTGNFGNVLAGWMLSRMGVRGMRFCVATNVNAVVSNFFKTGEYRPGTVTPSHAPSMDIQQASNLERWLWWHFNGNGARVREIMTTLQHDGKFVLDEIPENTDMIRAISCDNAGIETWIRRAWLEKGYLADPHTACAFAAVREDTRGVILATAHPAKFPEVIASVTGQFPQHPSLEILKKRTVIKHILPADVEAVKIAINSHCKNLNYYHHGNNR